MFSHTSLAGKKLFALLAFQIEMHCFLMCQPWSLRNSNKTALPTMPNIPLVQCSNVFLKLWPCVKSHIASITHGCSLPKAGPLNMQPTEGSIAEHRPTMGTGSILNRFSVEAMGFNMLASIAVWVERLLTNLAYKWVGFYLKDICKKVDYYFRKCWTYFYFSLERNFSPFLLELGNFHHLISSQGL